MLTLTRSGRRIFVSICISAFLWYGEAYAAENYIVIEVKPQMSLIMPGKKYSVGDTIQIPRDTTVTLLGEDGELTKINGPVAITVTPDPIKNKSSDDHAPDENVNMLSKIGDFLLRSRVSETTFGGTRTGQQALSDPWTIEIDRASAGCFRNGVIGLRRLDASDKATVEVQFDNRSDVFSFSLAKGETFAYLPPGFSEGRVINSLNVVRDNKMIKMFELPKSKNSSNLLQILSWMIDVGCTAQALNLVPQLASKAQDLN